jgi:hypothetical protein
VLINNKRADNFETGDFVETFKDFTKEDKYYNIDKD